MINTTQLDEVMAAYPDFYYNIRQLEDGIELRITRRSKNDDGAYYRTIKKVFKEEEDLRILHSIIQGKDD